MPVSASEVGVTSMSVSPSEAGVSLGACQC